MRKLGRDHIVVAEGLGMINFNKMIVLNDTAAYLWESLQGKEFNASTIKDLLLEKYDVAPETALVDAENIIKKWTEAGLTE